MIKLYGKTLLVSVLLCTAAYGKSYLPASDAQVVQRSMLSPASAAGQRLQYLRKKLQQNPADLSTAVALAKRYIELARNSAEPRYYGYAEAALATWWQQPQAPSEVLLLRATILQNRHQFAAALDDLTQLLQRNPRHAQAWLSRAVILAVQGEYQQALQNCLPLYRLVSKLLALTCRASMKSLSGAAEQSFQHLKQVLQNQPSADQREQYWAFSVLAEIAMRLGRTAQAEYYFKQALAIQQDVYLLASYADLLVQQKRYLAVRDLLADVPLSTTLLLRLAQAEQHLSSGRLPLLFDQLQQRMRLLQWRQDQVHFADQARFALYFTRQPEQALQLALQHWQQEREPKDARLVLAAAVQARDPVAAKPILEWLQQTGLEDVALNELVQQLREISP